MMDTAILTARGVSKHFGGVVAVDDVSFAANPGKILGIIGQNGAGKTTLFNIIAGHHAITGGEIYISGTEISREPAWRRSHRGIARTFQVPQPIWDLTLRENVQVGLAAKGLRRVEAVRRADAALEELGLAHRRDAMPSDLSPGQLRLLEFARASVLDPTVLLLDEVFAGLSLAEQDQTKTIIRALAEAGIAIVWIEHNVKLMMELADTILVMDKGRMVVHDTPAAVSADQRVIDIYLGPGREKKQ